MFRDRIHIDLGDLFHRTDKLFGMRLGIGDHVVAVDISTDNGFWAVFVYKVIVAINRLVGVQNTPGPQVALQLSGLGVHQRFRQALGVAIVALPAGLVRNPERAGVRIKGVRTPEFGQVARRAGVRFFGRCGTGRAAVAYHAPARVTVIRAHRLDRLHHDALCEIFDPVMAGQASFFRRQLFGDGDRFGCHVFLLLPKSGSRKKKGKQEKDQRTHGKLRWYSSILSPSVMSHRTPRPDICQVSDAFVTTGEFGAC